jgi:hypothetical protein
LVLQKLRKVMVQSVVHNKTDELRVDDRGVEFNDPRVVEFLQDFNLVLNLTLAIDLHGMT